MASISNKKTKGLVTLDMGTEKLAMEDPDEDDEDTNPPKPFDEDDIEDVPDDKQSVLAFEYRLQLF